MMTFGRNTFSYPDLTSTWVGALRPGDCVIYTGPEIAVGASGADKYPVILISTPKFSRVPGTGSWYNATVADGIWPNGEKGRVWFDSSCSWRIFDFESTGEKNG